MATRTVSYSDVSKAPTLKGSPKPSKAPGFKIDSGGNFTDSKGTKTPVSVGGKTYGNVSDGTPYQASTTVSPVAAPVAVDTLGAVAPITMPQPSVDTTGATSIVAGADQTTKGIDAYIKEITPPETETSKQYNDLLGQINTLLPDLANKSKDQAQVEKDLKLPKLKQDLAALNSQILSSVAGYEKAIANEDLAPGETPLNVVMGKQAVIRRNQAADIGLLQARALGLAGQVEMAQEAADRAISLKYDTIRDTLEVKMQQLQLIQPILDKEERRWAAALERKYTEEREALAEKKAEAKENIAIAFQAGVTSGYINKGGKFARVSDGKSYSSAQEFFKDAGVNSFEDAYRRGLVTDITAERLADIDYVRQLRNDYPDAGISFGDDAYTASQKLANSNKYLRENQSLYETGAPDLVDLGNGVKGVYNPESGLFEPVSLPNSAPGVLGKEDQKVLTTAPESKKLRSYQELNAAYTRYRDIIKKEGFALSGEGRTLLDQAYANVKIAWKNAAELGALTGPDIQVLEEAIKPATGWRAAKPWGPSPDSLIKALDAEIANNRSLARTNYDLLVSQNPNFEGSDYLNQLASPFGFSGAGAAGSANQVKGMQQKKAPLPLLNMDGSPKTPKLPITKAYPPGSLGGQCGVWVRGVVNKMGLDYPRVGDSLAEKAATARKYGGAPKIGSVVLTNENKVNGHVALIIGRAANGWVLGESNYGLNGKVNYGRVIPFNSPSILGFINPSKKG